MPRPPSGPTSGLTARVLYGAIALAIVAGAVPDSSMRAEGGDHLVVREIAIGGASASDEFIELFNPAPAPLSLAHLEVAYVSASGATVSQRATWGADAPHVPPGGHVLLANEAGMYAAWADLLYGGGLAAAGGAVILRSVGAAVAIDAVAWGTATGSWLEGNPAQAPAPGFSIERATDPSDGRVLDTDDNATDFVVRTVPTPQAAVPALAAATPMPTPLPTAPPPLPTPGGTAVSTPTPAPSATATPGPLPTSIADARLRPNGASVTVEGIALTSSGFHDGGGYLADAGAGIAVLVEEGSFAAGSRLIVTGTIDDRFAQRTIRARAADVHVLGNAVGAEAVDVSTGSIGEALEGRLVRVSATVRGSPSVLSTGLAFEVDDGSGAVRVLVGSATGIDSAAWTSGASVELIGVVGQRDSSGTGSSGYRLMPRSSTDVLRVAPPSAPTQGSSPSTAPSPTPASTPARAAVTSIAAARAAPTGTPLTLRGVVTMPSGVVDAETAVIQDDTGAIVLRGDAQAAPMRAGELVEVSGVRSTKSGMETLRATSEPRVLASGAGPVPTAALTGDVSEELEAHLVLVAGRLLASARRAASGTVSFDIDDGTGAVRVVMPASLQADDSALVSGVSVEVVGVVGQETTAADPLAGYRIWPRTAAEVRVLDGAEEDRGGSSVGFAESGSTGTRGAERPELAEVPETQSGTLGSVGTVGLASLRVGATLVAGEWPELAIGGLLWDGERLVAISTESTTALAMLAPRRPPIPIAVGGMRVIGVEPRSGAPLVALGGEIDDIAVASGAPAAPRVTVPLPGEAPAWVTLVGRLVGGAGGLRLEVGDATIPLEIACTQSQQLTDGVLSVTGIGVGDSPRIIVPCDGIRAAPTLARVAALSAPTAGKVQRVVDKDHGGDSQVAGDPRRPLAAWLLALGVLVVGSAAVLRRRLQAAVESERPEDDFEERPEGPEGPHLTLVRLRRDGGS